MTPPCCETCFYSRPAIFAFHKECHRHAPAALDPRDVASEGRRFPVVQDSEYCGDYQTDMRGQQAASDELRREEYLP